MRAYRVLIVGTLAAAVCVRLGFWQVSRLHQRQAFRATAEARLRMPPVGLGAGTAVGRKGSDTLAYRLAIAAGVFDFTRQVVVVARTVDQVPGVYVVTPLRLADGAAVLVERGWAPSPDAYRVQLDSLSEPGSAAVKGILLAVTASREFALRDTTWPVYTPSDDPTRLSDRYPYPLHPWVLRRTDSGAASSGLRPIPVPLIDNGPHLSYAIQWFAFATIALVGSVLLFVRETRNGKPDT